MTKQDVLDLLGHKRDISGCYTLEEYAGYDTAIEVITENWEVIK